MSNPPSRMIYLHSKNKCSLDTNIMNYDTAEVAAYNHQAESQSIASIDEMRRLSTSSTERVHGTPYWRVVKTSQWLMFSVILTPRGAEITQTQDRHIEERRSIPFHYSISVDCSTTGSRVSQHTWIIAPLFAIVAARLDVVILVCHSAPGPGG